MALLFKKSPKCVTLYLSQKIYAGKKPHRYLLKPDQIMQDRLGPWKHPEQWVQASVGNHAMDRCKANVRL